MPTKSKVATQQPIVALDSITSAEQAVAAGYKVVNFSTLPEALKAAAAQNPNGTQQSQGQNAELPNDGKLRTVLIASAHPTDIGGDVMDASALQKMVSGCLGRTVFLNHQWIVPYSVYGAVEAATLVTLTDKNTGKVYQAVRMVVLVDTTVEAAALTYQIIQNGIVSIGASITVIILQEQRQKDGTNLITDIYYLEVSLVGIPAQQNSWVEKSLKPETGAETRETEVENEAIGPAADTDVEAVANEISVTAISISKKGQGAGTPLMKKEQASDQAEKETIAVLVEQAAPATTEPIVSKDLGDPMPGDTSAASLDMGELQVMQLLHDYCSSKGATCPPQQDDGDNDSDTGTMSASVKQESANAATTQAQKSLAAQVAASAKLIEEIATLKAANATLETERAEAEAVAETAVAALETFRSEPFLKAQV